MRSQGTRRSTSDVEVATLVCCLVILSRLTSIRSCAHQHRATEFSSQHVSVRRSLLIHILSTRVTKAASTQCRHCTKECLLHPSRVCIHQLVLHRLNCNLDFLGFLDFFGFEIHRLLQFLHRMLHFALPRACVIMSVGIASVATRKCFATLRSWICMCRVLLPTPLRAATAMALEESVCSESCRFRFQSANKLCEPNPAQPPFCECIVLTFSTTESNDVLRCGAVSEQVYSSPQDHAKCASTRHWVSSPVAVQVHFQLRLVRTSHGSTPKFCRLRTFEVWTVFSRICLGCAQLHPRSLDNVAQNKFEIFQQLRSILLVRLDFRCVLLRLSCQSILFRISSAAVCQSSQLGVLLLQSQSRLHGKIR